MRVVLVAQASAPRVTEQGIGVVEVADLAECLGEVASNDRRAIFADAMDTLGEARILGRRRTRGLAGALRPSKDLVPEKV